MGFFFFFFFFSVDLLLDFFFAWSFYLGSLFISQSTSLEEEVLGVVGRGCVMMMLILVCYVASNFQI
jgi:hypothetical protein